MPGGAPGWGGFLGLPNYFSLARINASRFLRDYANMFHMKAQEKPPLRRDVKIVVDRSDPRLATVRYDGKVLFTLKTDVSGMHPSLVVVATETYLKFMAKGKTGIALWNGTAGLTPRNPKPS
jgi:hypothetical protein